MSVTMADHIANVLRYIQASDLRLYGFPETVAICLVTFVHRDFQQGMSEHSHLTRFSIANLSQPLTQPRSSIVHCIKSALKRYRPTRISTKACYEPDHKTQAPCLIRPSGLIPLYIAEASSILPPQTQYPCYHNHIDLLCDVPNKAARLFFPPTGKIAKPLDSRIPNTAF